MDSASSEKIHKGDCYYIKRFKCYKNHINSISVINGV